ncbi:homocysteine S-methyltransferase family protein [Marinomonas sp. C2222]|uniref:Homocysteine S-methyltransferase family protein n=1 Tax=Marinomonas sargassi TaxID=2984494 RepID=A0ABT2YNZ4_9GAMM|nr:homocysteine S-methyltransferase family protein [Marinomonas sargassi]MCV2401597.1 homocysteine S-methyltransferase family protein [Marinomonas sargassi]
MKKVTILDGGIGRELKRIGAPFSQPLWSAQALIDAPHFVAQAHQNFIDAGANIITVNSYACVPFHLGEELYQQQGEKLAEQAAIIAKESAQSANQKVLVAGSLPPPLGSYRPDLFEAQQANSILSTLFSAQDKYVDIWLAETISSIEEAKAIAQVLKDTPKPCYYAFTLNDDTKGPAQLRSGELVADAVEAVLTEAVAGVFFNCSIPEVMAQAIKITADILEEKKLTIDIGVFANSFTPISQGHEANLTTQSSRDLTPEEYLTFAKKWQCLGANIIGGCCGIEPSHIKALSEWLKTT